MEKRSIFDESVNGTVIGAITWPYEFWINEPCEWLRTKREVPLRRVAKGHFTNDDQAIAWFKENYPKEFKYGVEMRCFDQD